MTDSKPDRILSGGGPKWIETKQWDDERRDWVLLRKIIGWEPVIAECGKCGAAFPVRFPLDEHKCP